MTKIDLSNLSHFKTQTSSLYEKNNAVYYFQIPLFVVWNMQISQVMMSLAKAKFWSNKNKNLSQFVSEMFDSLQWDSTRDALQNELDVFVTMATYWVSDLPDIKGSSVIL